MEKRFFEEPNVRIGEVQLKVTDIDRAVSFYQNVIGMRVLERSAGHAAMTVDGEKALVTLLSPEGVAARAGRHSGLYHFALLLSSRADLSVFLRHLLQTGYPFGAADHAVSEALYITDPDGNGIEVYRDRPSSEWRWEKELVTMVTEQLDGEGILAESNAEWTGLASDTIIGHIHLHVGNVELAQRYYEEGLGFGTVAYYPQAAFMSTGGYHHHIAINTWQGVGAPPAPEQMAGMDWYAIVLPTESARERVVEQLQRIGAPVKQLDGEYETSDPAGNRIRLRVA